MKKTKFYKVPSFFKVHIYQSLWSLAWSYLKLNIVDTSNSVSYDGFPLPLGVWEGLRFVIVALPGLFSYLFWIGWAGWMGKDTSISRSFTCSCTSLAISIRVKWDSSLKMSTKNESHFVKLCLWGICGQQSPWPLKVAYPASILYKSIAGRYRPVSYPDGLIMARYRFINAY